MVVSLENQITLIKKKKKQTNKERMVQSNEMKRRVTILYFVMAKAAERLRTKMKMSILFGTRIKNLS